MKKEKQGVYWKIQNNATIYWAKEKTNIRKDFTFTSIDQYKKHRVAHGYGPGWSGILVLNNYIESDEEDISNIESNNIELEIKENPKSKNNSYDFECGFEEIDQEDENEIPKISNVITEMESTHDISCSDNYNKFQVIYIVHLNKYIDRKNNILKQLDKLYNVKIIDAVDKDIIDFKKLQNVDLMYHKNNLYCADTKFCWCNGNGHGKELFYPGRVACLWSHSKVYDDMVMNNIQNALVLEDDFDLIVDTDFLKMIERKLPPNYEYIYFAHSRGLDGRFEYTDYDEHFVKVLRPWKETICYAISFGCALKLQQVSFPFRGAIDGLIRQCVETTKIIENVYCSRTDIARNLSGFAGGKVMTTTVDNTNKNKTTDTIIESQQSIINKKIFKLAEYDIDKQKKEILFVTGYWNVKNKYKTNINNVYLDWMKNTLLIPNDMCIFYDDDEVFKKIHEIRIYSLNKTYYIKKTIDKFFVNKFDMNDIEPTKNVPSVDLGKIYNEKMFLVHHVSVKYNNYHYYGWIDIGLPLFRKKPIIDKTFINFKILNKDKLNCCLTNFGLRNKILEDFSNNIHNIYYHNVAGGAWIIHKDKVNKFSDMYYKELESMIILKNKINNSLILDDQCIWTKVYSKNSNLFNIIPGRYGEYISKLLVPIKEYGNKGPGGLGNQLINLMLELFINRWEKYEVSFNFKETFTLSKLFKKNVFKIKLDGYGSDYKVIHRFYKYEMKEDLKSSDVKEYSLNKIINLIDFSICLDKSHYDCIIHLRSHYDNDDHHYYLQPPMCYYDYIFENFDLGENIAIVYGIPMNPIVNELKNKYNIKTLISNSAESDLITMSNCTNLIWDTSTMCWASYLISNTIERNFIFDDFKKFIRSTTFLDDNTFKYIDVNKEIIDNLGRDNINDIKINTLLCKSVKRESDILLITGFWKVKNKYKSQSLSDTYYKWMENTLLINNDLCILCDDEILIQSIQNIREKINYNTYYIHKKINDFDINRFDLSVINSNYHVPSDKLCKIYLEKIRFLKNAKNKFTNYKYYGWMDIGIPIYRNNIPKGIVHSGNGDILNDNIMNCNHTHHRVNDKDMLDKMKNQDYSHYYHTIAGSCYVLHKNIVDKYDELFYTQFEKLLNIKIENSESIEDRILGDDQVIWTHIYSENRDLFNFLPGSYGEILNKLTHK